MGSNHNIRQISDAALDMGYTVVGILDDDYFGNREHIAGIPVIGSELQRDFDHDHDYFVAINWIADRSSRQRRNQIRRRIMIDHLMDFNLVNIIHPSAKVADSAMLGKGIFIGADAHVGHGCSIGNGTQIKPQSYIAHDAVIESGVVLQVQSYVGAGVQVGSHSYLGVGARIVPSDTLRICSHSFIKSNALVTESTLSSVCLIEWPQES